VNRTIQEGDVFAAACGEKEPRGCVRALGLGPTPHDISTLGLKSYIPTRLQMEVLARKRAEREIVALQQCLEEKEELLQERMVHERENVEIISAWFKFTTPRGNVLYPSIIACHLIS